jgi:hypothetical protein
LVFVLINGLVNQQTEEIAGYDVVLTASSIVLMLSFQFFFMESFVMVYTKDQKTSMRFRLGVSPVPKGHFLLRWPAAVICMLCCKLPQSSLLHL